MPGGRGAPPWLAVETLALVGGSINALRLLADAPEAPPVRHAVPAPDGTPADPPPDALAAWPRVSIIVPARNEERNLPALLPSLIDQAYPRDRFEVIVVDDQSTDRTPAILAGFTAAGGPLRVVPGRPLPPGWKGKPWAMAQGVAAARGDWLLFTDADTVHAPTALATAVADAVDRGADLYTIMPAPVLGSPGERLIMPVVMLGILTFFAPARVNDPRSPVAIANGQFILIRRSVYDAVGGAEAVRADIAEDLEMARRVKRAGYRLVLADGSDLMRVRMYTNFRETWAGWRKNVLLSMKKEPASGVLQVAALLIGGILPFVLFPLYLARALGLGARPAPAARSAAALLGVQIVTLLVIKRRLDARLGLPWGWTFAYPLATFAFLGILLDSFWRLLSGQGVTWKGRAYTE